MSALQDTARLVTLDLRMAARGFWALLGRRPNRIKALVVVGGVVALHALALVAALHFDEAPQTLAIAARSGALFLLTWSVASALTTTTRWLYLRGDLDLMLSSPVDGRALVAARLTSLALGSVASVGVVLAPFANVSVALGRLHWAALYPALAAAGFSGASIGFLLALALFFGLGPRRARVVSQIVASLVGASAVLATQAFSMLPEGWRTRIYDALAAHVGEGDVWRRLFELPERAALGDVGALIGWLAAAGALFASALVFGARPFFAAAVISAGAPTATTKNSRIARFRTRLGAAMRVKEHRLLWRDPWLISQMLLQALYTLPVGVVLWRQGGVIGQPGVAFGPMLAVIAGQFAGSLAWLALSAEDAPDFVATAPATRGEVECAKLAAILTPVAIVMAPPLLALAWISHWGGLTAVLGAAGSAASGAMLMLWRQAPARRGMVLRRHSQSKLVALGEHWLSGLWAMATAMAAIGSVACLAPLALVALTLWLVSPARVRPVAPLASRSLSTLNIQ